LRTEDGHLIYAHYPGLFHSSPDVAQRFTQGELVDPSEYYFRTAPLFETASDEYAWLNRILAVRIGRRMPGQVGYGGPEGGTAAGEPFMLASLCSP